MYTTTQLSENSHQGFEGLKAHACLASMDAKSNTASGLQACLRREGIGSRCSGKERDETNLDYFGARYFSGATGRFTSADAPFADQYEENPQSWNLYQYGYNNPLSNIDVDGRSVWTKIAKVGWKLIKTGNAAAAFTDNIQDGKTLFNSEASAGSRILAGAMLASEILPVSGGDFKDVGRLLGLVDKAGDTTKQVIKHGGDVKSSVPNPFGKKGGPKHQGKIDEVVADIENRGLQPVREVRIDTPGSEKSKRFVDVGAKDKDGNLVELHQVGKQNKNGTPVSRERKAIEDINKQKIYPEVLFNPYNR